MKIINTIYYLLFVFGCISLHTATYIANPANYLNFRDQLVAGDTLLLTPGNYTDGLRLNNINGYADNWIVIKSEVPHEAVLLGRDGSNTMDITDCSYIKIEGLKFDGHKIPYIDAIKASGSATNWAHHIWIHNNIIIRHDSDQQTVGISTKIPCWNWTISYNKIMSAGTGLYLGNSDGNMPFIRGIIEYNFVLNPVGYCMQIKHQNDRPSFPGIPTLPSSTIVRHNVFAKNDRESPDGDRPNVLFGGQPLSGTGSDDRVECYGNFFYNNPREFLLQATGNVSVHHNIFVISPEGAMTFQPHNSRSPKEIFVYNNSIYNVNIGVRITNPVPTEKQIIMANAIFATTPISAQSANDNLTGLINEADSYFNNPSTIIGEMDFYPKSGTSKAKVDYLFMEKDIDYDLDFNGNQMTISKYGAYSGEGSNPGWKLSLDIKGSGVTSVEENYKNDFNILLYPNPATDFININVGAIHELPLPEIRLFNIFGECVTTFGNESLNFDRTGTIQKINLSGLCNGMYILRVNSNKKLLKSEIIQILR
ncbi:MAG: T9SS type A sorting domain-containing protein [Bacteroidetes bacterium]|nr:MAG: T9SS type A sorting domain-containing protein [Bacteroidota bacterium]